MHLYDVVFFDLDHTLVDTKRQYDLGLTETLHQMYGSGLPQGYQSRFLSHHQSLWKQYDNREISMKELRRQRFLRAWKDYGVERSVDEADDFYEMYVRTFDHTLFPYDGIQHLLAELAKNHVLAIITNGSPDMQWKKMQITGISDFFHKDHLIISEEIGAAKPHPSVFQAACERLSVNKGQAVMVGDNYQNDVVGARQFGMDSVWFAPDLSVVPKSLQSLAEKPIERAMDLFEHMLKMESVRTV